MVDSIYVLKNLLKRPVDYTLHNQQNNFRILNIRVMISSKEFGTSEE